MNAADYLILAILAISTVYGVARGFMREALGVLAWLGGLWLAWRYADDVKPLLGGLLADEPQSTWAARVFILTAVVLCTWLLAEVLSYFIHQSGLSVSVDRFLGGVFGMMRGAVLVALLVMLGMLLRLNEVRWWQRSALVPYAVTVSGWIGAFAETALKPVVNGVLKQ